MGILLDEQILLPHQLGELLFSLTIQELWPLKNENMNSWYELLFYPTPPPQNFFLKEIKNV